jgi:transposase InsO family protein
VGFTGSIVTVSRPGGLRAGTEIRLGGQTHTIAAVTGSSVWLSGVTGAPVEVSLATVLSDPSLELVAGGSAPLPASAVLEVLDDELLEQAHWWERHILEVLTGRPPDAVPGQVARPDYDPAATTLRQREVAKVAELAAGGRQVSLKTLQRLRLGYEREGLRALIDGRATRGASPTGRVDERVVEAARQAIAEETSRASGTVARVERRTRKILQATFGDDAPAMPSQRTFYRLVARLSAGKHTFGSARTRRSLAKQPAGPFGAVTALRPGEWMQIDSTPLNVAVVLDNGLIDRVELTWLIDVATRTIPAAVLRPSTKAVDAAVLLARSLTPEPMRPGWNDALRMARSVLPHRRLTEIDERLEHAAARPVIVPETIVCDHGMVYMSQTFRNACRAMGINLQPTHKGSPWEKGTVETSFNSVDTLFAQYVAGYLGNSVENRGEKAEQAAVWSMIELQELLDEWIVTAWQNRPHDGLRDPLTPGRALTPNEKYAALVETAGYVPVPLTNADYIELLPATWRAISSPGIKIKHRKYDAKALNPYRHQHSGVTAKKGLWEVHRDPYDVSRVWVRNHHDGGWIQATWTHLKTAPRPFGEQVWDHARQILARRGEDPATEAEIAEAAQALLDKAEQGPATDGPSRKDRRVAARARALTDQARFEGEALVPPGELTDEHDSEDEQEAAPVAKVIPLGIFDPFAEARKRR